MRFQCLVIFFGRSDPDSQYATAVYRHASDDHDATAADGSADACGRLSVAPGGPDDAALLTIDARSPVTGFLVRVERLFAAQVRHSENGGHGLLHSHVLLGRFGPPCVKTMLPSMTAVGRRSDHTCESV